MNCVDTRTVHDESLLHHVACDHISRHILISSVSTYVANVCALRKLEIDLFV